MQTIKRMLFLIMLLSFLFGCQQKPPTEEITVQNKNESVNLPKMKPEYGEPIGAWSDNKKQPSYICITDKLYFLEYDPSKGEKWLGENEGIKPCLVKVDEYLYCFDFSWNSTEWLEHWNEKTENEKQKYKNFDEFKKNNAALYGIGCDGQLINGTFYRISNSQNSVECNNSDGLKPVFISEKLISFIESNKKKPKIESEESKRENKIKSQFSVFDGSHIKLEKFIKENMNDPKSYEHVSSQAFDQKKNIRIVCKFRGKNSFGAIVMNTIKADVDIDGNVLSIAEQTP